MRSLHRSCMAHASFMYYIIVTSRRYHHTTTTTIAHCASFKKGICLGDVHQKIGLLWNDDAELCSLVQPE